MSKVYLEDSTLTGIADAIRAKTGGSASITPANMATEIGTISGGGGVTQPLVMSEIKPYVPPEGVDGFSSVTPQFDIVLTDKDLNTNIRLFTDYDFTDYKIFAILAPYIHSLTINLCQQVNKPSSSSALNDFFAFSNMPINFPIIINLGQSKTSGNIKVNFTRMYHSAPYLTGEESITVNVIPEGKKFDFGDRNAYIIWGSSGITSSGLKKIPSFCSYDATKNELSLIEYIMKYYDSSSSFYCPRATEYVPKTLLQQLDGKTITTQTTGYRFRASPNIRANIHEFYIPYVKITATGGFVDIEASNNYHLQGVRKVIFAPGWKNSNSFSLIQAGRAGSFNLNFCGYFNSVSSQELAILDTTKRITDSTSYEALKNDPDAWTSDLNYSFFNHDAMVELINSLPDLQNNLVTSSQTMSIQVKNNQGLYTDGGPMSNLTSVETAVATSRGWTISLVN